MKAINGEGFRFLLETHTNYYYVPCTAIVDIEVEPGVEKIVFSGAEKVLLSDVMKQFPDVRTIELSDTIRGVDISNFMFPNVEEVISKSEFFQSGPCLIESGILRNAFCKKAGTDLDLKDINSVSDYALEGCMADLDFEAKAYINGDSVSGCRKLIGMEAKEGVIELGGKIISLVSDEIHIPETIQNCMDDNIEIPSGATIRIDGENALDLILRSFRKQKGYSLQMELPNSFEAISLIEKFRKAEIDNSKISVSENPFCMTADGILYSKDRKALIRCPRGAVGEIIIPEGVERISSEAFKKCEDVVGVRLPKSVKEIESSAFSGCLSLERVVMKEGIETIGEKAFCDCTSLKEISIPGTVKKIGNRSFENCKKLSSVSLKEGLEEIGSDVFCDSFSLDSISIPGTVERIGGGAFPYLKKIELRGEKVPFGLLRASSRDLGSFCQIKENYSIIECSFPSGKKFFVPYYIKEEFARNLDTMLKLYGSTEAILNTLYKYAYHTEGKQECAVRMYCETGSKELRAYLRRSSKSICETYVILNRQDALVDFLKLGTVSESALKYVINHSDNMPAVKAYALEMAKDSKSFRL